jgi:putative heme-binding domain-containing protein
MLGLCSSCFGHLFSDQEGHDSMIDPRGALCALIALAGRGLAVVLAVSSVVRSQGYDSAGPRPAAVWPAGPLELVVAFPGPVDPGWAAASTGRAIPYFEPIGKGRRQLAPQAPLGNLRIASVTLRNAGRTLLLATDPHPRQARYELLLGPQSERGSPHDYDLSGVAVEWFEGKDDAGAEATWKGWWPDLDVEATRRLTRGSAPHERILGLIVKPGRLVLSTQVLLPPGDVKVRIRSGGSIADATLGDEQAAESPRHPGAKVGQVELAVRSQGEPLFLTLTVATGEGGRPSSLRASFAARHEEPLEFKPIERTRLLLPWAPPSPGPTAEAQIAVPDLAGGDPRRGEALFFGDQARCAQCHEFRGRGASIGPDLTAIASKGMDQIYRSIAAPSAEIAPDYVPYSVSARDGRVFVGLVRAEGASAIRITDTNAKTTTLARDEVDQIRPSGNSIMPVGLAGTLGEASLRDLIAYLTSGSASLPTRLKGTSR